MAELACMVSACAVGCATLCGWELEMGIGSAVRKNKRKKLGNMRRGNVGAGGAVTAELVHGYSGLRAGGQLVRDVTQLRCQRGLVSR